MPVHLCAKCNQTAPGHRLGIAIVRPGRWSSFCRCNWQYNGTDRRTFLLTDFRFSCGVPGLAGPPRSSSRAVCSSVQPSWTIAPNAPQSRRNQLIRNSYCGLPFHTVTPESTFHWLFCNCGSTAIAPVTQKNSRNMMMLVGSM